MLYVILKYFYKSLNYVRAKETSNRSKACLKDQDIFLEAFLNVLL